MELEDFAKVMHDNPNRDNLHTLTRQEEQLNLSKINFKKNIDLGWLYPKKTKNKNYDKFALIVPGGSKRGLIKEFYPNFLKNYKIF